MGATRTFVEYCRAFFDDEEVRVCREGILGGGMFGCWSGDVGKLVMVFLQRAKNACQTGRENVIGGLDGGTVRRCGQECSLAGVQMQVAGGERSVSPKLTVFYFLPLF